MINYSLNKTIATTVISPATTIAAAGLIQNKLSELIATTVFTAPPTPDERYIVARNNLERFSILGTWTTLSAIATTDTPLGWKLSTDLHTDYLPTNKNSIFYNQIDSDSDTATQTKSFPLHLNLHLLNVIYYNSLTSDFFKDLIVFPSLPVPAVNNNLQTYNDAINLQGYNPVTSTEPAFSSIGTLPSLGLFIKSLAAEPTAFPLIIKLPSDEFLFLFVARRSSSNVGVPSRPAYFDLRTFLTEAQQKEITNSKPINSYIDSLYTNQLNVLSYLSIKICKKADGTIYYTPTEMYSLDNINVGHSSTAVGNGAQASGRRLAIEHSILTLKSAYTIAMFCIALKLLGHITLPKIYRKEPHPFDVSLTAAVRTLLNPNYISMYDRKNVAYYSDPVNKPFAGHTFVSSPYWSTSKTASVGSVDSYPDLLGLGDISSNIPCNNEIPFIEISQWDITEGMLPDNDRWAWNLKGSTGLINDSDYVGTQRKTLRCGADQTSGILIRTSYEPGWIPGISLEEGFVIVPHEKYYLHAKNTLFSSLRMACYKNITPTQQGNFANAKYSIKSTKKRNLGEPVITIKKTTTII